MTVKEAKEMDMVDYLSKLGHEPQEIKGHNYWYLSPLREEKTPSFKVNRKMNRYYDWGEGRGGNLVDFGVRYYKCSVAEFLKKLIDFLHNTSNMRLIIPTQSAPKLDGQDNDKSQIRIIGIRPITSFPLLRYCTS